MPHAFLHSNHRYRASIVRKCAKPRVVAANAIATATASSRRDASPPISTLARQEVLVYAA